MPVIEILTVLFWLCLAAVVYGAYRLWRYQRRRAEQRRRALQMAEHQTRLVRQA
jgi:cytochrome c-type biogenesis protein CcmH/NrfF